MFETSQYSYSVMTREERALESKPTNLIEVKVEFEEETFIIE